MDSKDEDMDVEEGKSDGGIVQISWNKILETYQKYYFQLQENDRTKLLFCNDEKVKSS